MSSSRYRLRHNVAMSSSRYHLRQNMATTSSSYHESPQIRDEVVVKLQVRRKNVEEVLMRKLAVNIKKMMMMIYHRHHFYYYY
jgi:hypothetical protein